MFRVGMVLCRGVLGVVGSLSSHLNLSSHLLASDIELLLDQVPNVILAIENSVHPSAFDPTEDRLTDVEVN